MTPLSPNSSGSISAASRAEVTFRPGFASPFISCEGMAVCDVGQFLGKIFL